MNNTEERITNKIDKIYEKNKKLIGYLEIKEVFLENQNS